MSPFLRCCLALVFACNSWACGSDSDSDGDPGSGGGSGNGGSSGSGARSGSGGSGAFADCGGKMFAANGTLDEAEYEKQATLWDAPTIDCRLGPKYEELHAGDLDERPTAWPAPEQDYGGGLLCKKYQLGTPDVCPSGSCDFGSTSGQVGYATDDANDDGMNRIQTYGYEHGVICENVQTGDWLKSSQDNVYDPGYAFDPAIPVWEAATGLELRLPRDFNRTEMVQTNGGVGIFVNGLVGATGNQTSGDKAPYFELPAGKVPTAVAMTTWNEFALVTLWDTNTHSGQLAVFALRANKPEAFSLPYFAMANEAGFTAIHLMGYVDLPDMKTPTAVAVSGNNGRVGGPSQGAIGNTFANIENDPDLKQQLQRDDGERILASSGHAVVLSRWENKVTFVDLRPLFQFVRSAYFADQASWDASKVATDWPHTFETAPDAKPVVVTTLDIDAPTVARVGNKAGPFDDGQAKPLKALVGTVSGDIVLFNLDAFSAEERPVPPSSIVEVGRKKVCDNITSLVLSGAYNFGNSGIVACRGSRSVQSFSVEEAGITDGRVLTDTGLADPVVIDRSDRGPVWTIGDFSGKRVLNFRLGPTEDNAGKPPAGYGCGEGGADADCDPAELGGVLDLPGGVYLISTSNVN
jgi:hypothetical protein